LESGIIIVCVHIYLSHWHCARAQEAWTENEYCDQDKLGRWQA
jgi:hypothetical protein